MHRPTALLLGRTEYWSSRELPRLRGDTRRKNRASIKGVNNLDFVAHRDENTFRNFEGTAADGNSAKSVGATEFVEFGTDFLIDALHIWFIV